RQPAYQYRLDGFGDEWSVPTHDATISLTGLFEGRYRMSVRMVDVSGSVVGEPTTFTFSIAPPFYRAWYAYATYAVLAGGATWLVALWFLRRARAKQEALEQLVRTRTQEVDRTNAQLRAAVTQA